MLGNVKNPDGNSGLAEEQNERSFETINYTQSTQPQFSRSYNQSVNCDKAEYSNESIREPLYATAMGQGGLQTSHYSDHKEILKPDSVIIDLDNINESSTSHLVDLYELQANATFPERFQQNVSLQESSGPSVEQNSSHQIREANGDTVNGNCNNENNSSNISNNNSNDAGDDNNNSRNNSSSRSNSNNNNTSVIPNTEGSPAENLFPRTQTLEEAWRIYYPFVTFLLLKVIYDHKEEVQLNRVPPWNLVSSLEFPIPNLSSKCTLIFIVLLLKFFHANYVVKREIAKQNRRSLISLGIVFANLSVCISFIYFVFQDQHLYKNLVFIPPHLHPLSVWDVFWIVGITDFVLKFITIQLKIVLTCLPAKWLPYSARGKWYLILEGTSQLYRGFVPIQPWLYYLMEVYEAPDSNVGFFFLSCYLFSKWSDVKAKVKLFLKAFFNLLDSASLGVRPSTEQLVTAGSQCPICHEEYNSPIILKCKHVFCESCALTWFDRERTCPLCRAKIADDPTWKDGATSVFTQLF